MLGPPSKSFVWDITNVNRTNKIKLYGEGQRGFKQEKLTEHFFCPNHNGTQKVIYVQIFDHCNPNEQERPEDFSIHTLKTMFPKGVNQKSR